MFGCLTGGNLGETTHQEAYGWHARTEFRFFLREGLQLGLHPEGSPVPLALSKCLLAAADLKGLFPHVSSSSQFMSVPHIATLIILLYILS